MLNLVCTVLGLLTLVYVIIKYYFSYWERKGFKSVPPTFPWGNFGPTFLQKTTSGEVVQKIYNKTKEPFIGIYVTFRPILVLCDPELIRNVFIKDFAYFTDRGVYIDEKRDPLSAHLFAMEGQKWKNLRGKLSPAFSSGKLKAMFSTIVDCCTTLEDQLKKAAENKVAVEVRDLSSKFTTNVIASVAFGIQIDCFSNPNNEFRQYLKKIFQPTFKNSIRMIAKFICPRLMRYTGLNTLDSDVLDFMMSVVQQNVEYREKNNITRKDFFQLLIQLRNTGTVQLDDQWETVIKYSAEDQKQLTMAQIAAQAYIFFVAGFETSSSTMSYTLYELAKHSDLQQRVQDEIDEVLQRHDNKITYDAVSEMKYLERCIDETLRKYPIVPILQRECVKNYKIPGTDLVIEKGTEIFIPALGLQRDAKYYPDPMRFDPNRFDEKNADTARPYMPFGDGPRICIGMRMGKMQAQVGLIAMLRRFKFTLDDTHTEDELSFEAAPFLLSPVGGIRLRISER